MLKEGVVDTARKRRARSWLLLLGLLLPTAWLCDRQLRLQVDVENASLKSTGSPEAFALARRIEQFGRDLVVMVAFEAQPAGAVGFTAEQSAGLESLAARVRAIDGVGSLRVLPGTIGASRVWAIGLDVAGSAFAPTVESIEALVREHAPAGLQPAISGQPVAEVVIAREVRAEQRRILPLVVGAFVVLLFLYYRHAGLILSILAPAGIGIVWTSGLYELLGRRLDPISVMLQPVLLTVGVAAGVHWIEAYLDERHAGFDPDEAARRAVLELRVPAMIAALTTVVGFLSLAFNSIPAVVDFGVFAALGIATTCTLAMLITPLLLGLFARDVSRRLVDRHGVVTGSAGRRAADWLAKRALAIRVGAALIAVLGLLAWSRLEVDNDPQRVLPAGHQFRRDTAVLASEIGGSEVFDVLVPGNSSFADPVRLGLFAAYVLSRPGVAGAAGPALHSEGGDWLARFLLAPGGSAKREALFAEIETRAAALGAGDVRVTGISVQIARDSDRLVRSTVWGSGASLLVLFVVFWIGFRSAFFAWLALIPNVLPCIVVYAALALAGRPLSFATAMISSVMLGLIVDDTIHLLHRFRELRAAGVEPLAAVEKVFQHSGRAIVITSVVLGLGFAIGLSGSLSTTIEFCALAATTIVVAFFSDLILLPAILVRARSAEAKHA